MPGIETPGASGSRGLWGSLVSPSLAYAGIDQGVDFTGSGDIYALGDGIVTRVQSSGSGWPGQGAVLNYKITSGAAAGRTVYVAEDFAPLVKVGQQIKAGQTIGHATGSGQAPGIEVGWAAPSGIPLAPRPAPRPASQWTQQGQSFADFVRSGNAGGQVSGVGGVVSHIPVVGGVVSGVEDVGSFLGKLTNPSYILRGLQIVAGAVLVLAGLYLLARQVGLSFTPGQAITGAADTVRRRDPLEQAYREGQLQGARREGRNSVGRREPVSTGTRSIDVSEAGERRAAVRSRAAGAGPSNEVPF